MLMETNRITNEAKKLIKIIKEGGAGGEDALFSFFDEELSTFRHDSFASVSSIIKKEEFLLDEKYMPFYEKWLTDYVLGWGCCDIFCYRVLNPMMEKYEKLNDRVFEWAIHDKPMVRRAALVSLIHSSQSFSVNVPFELVQSVVNILIDDGDKYVQNAIGWLLKYSYLSYPKQTLTYIESNFNRLKRTTFRYALEKMDSDTRSRMMQLTNN